MLIIGELINGMFKQVEKAIQEKDSTAIKKLALDQIKAGANALDINCGPSSINPISDISWLIETVQAATNATLVIDSGKPEVIAAGLKTCKNQAIINSVTADNTKLDLLIPLAKQYKTKLIALTINNQGIPSGKDQRIELAAQILQRCADENFSPSDVYLDPIAMPLNISQNQLPEILETIREIKILSTPAPKSIIGLSNISQGTKLRSIINQTFLTMAIYQGLDAVILNPLDTQLTDSLITAELILNKDIYCDSFIEAWHKKNK